MSQTRKNNIGPIWPDVERFIDMEIVRDDSLLNEVVFAVLGENSDISIDVVFSENLYSDALATCSNQKYCEFLHSRSPQEIAQCNSLNGIYIPPKDITSRQQIIISNRQRSDGYSHISTVAHETQHSKNYTEFCKMYCNNIFEDIATHQYNVTFQIWDEFAARRTGHRFYTGYVMQHILGWSIADITAELTDNQLPARLDEITQLLKQPNSVELYKNIAAILAMFNIWENDYGIIVSGLNSWSKQLYQSLAEYDSIYDVNFSVLDNTLRKLWNLR